MRLRPYAFLFLIACGGTADTGSPDAAVDGAWVDSSTPDALSDVVIEAGVADSGTNDGASSTDASISNGPYGSNGPETFSQASMTVNDGTSFTVQVYIPSTTGSHPVVILSSGLEQPASAYATYAERLASWGIIAILRDDPGVFTNTSTIVSDVEYVVGTWLSAQNKLSTSKLFDLVDTNNVGLAGHSRGGEVALLAAEGTAKGLVKGTFGLDPVDGTSGTVAITTIGSIGIPLAFIGETTDSASNGCAPAADNFMALYTAANAPSVAITAIHADHTMFEDPSGCMFCTLCTVGTASQMVVESEAARYLMAFFARELLGDSSVGAAFQGAGITSDVNAGLVSVVSK